MHEILGQTPYGPVVFGNNAPDSGNAELLAIGIESSGREEQRERWLQPLLDGRMRSGFSMTEPGAGADPTMIATTAVRDGDEWVINGHKWFTTNGSVADFLIVMAVTNPDVHPYQGCSMIVVPADTPGVEIVRDVATMEDPVEHFGKFGGHAEILYRRRAGARMRTWSGWRAKASCWPRSGSDPVASTTACAGWASRRRAFDMLCERAVSRTTHHSLLAEKQTIQNWVADSLAEMTAARLMTLYAAWKMDNEGAPAARVEIAMIKYYGAGRPLQRDRPGHPGPWGPRLLDRSAARVDVPARPGGPHLRRARRGPQGDRGPTDPQGLPADRGPDRARSHPTDRGQGALRPPARAGDRRPLTADRRPNRTGSKNAACRLLDGLCRQHP